jgi:hypothetical protein
MAFSKKELDKYHTIMEAYIKRRRPPAEIRDELDISYRIKGQSVEIFEIRPSYMDPANKTESAIAKTTFVRTQNVWKIYWQRQDLKWHGYPMDPQVKTLYEFLKIVDEDEMCCFWG